MKPSKLYEALHALIGERVPLHIWGACGVGKSQIVHQVADDLDYDFLDVRAVQLDPVDLRGLPRISADQTEWVPPKFPEALPTDPATRKSPFGSNANANGSKVRENFVMTLPFVPKVLSSTPAEVYRVNPI
jgi:MoxR-like ATPase